MLRVRITYKKSGDIIYTSNLDLQKIWERSCRRAELNIAYSMGFHPQAKIQQAAPLPLGFLSRTEIVDIWLDEDIELSFIKSRLNSALPMGLIILSIENIDLKEAALQNRITSSVYQVELPPDTQKDLLEQKINNLLNVNELTMTKRGKIFNLRERIESINFVENGSNDKLLLEMRLAQRPGLTGRPDDILNVLGIDPFLSQIERIALFYT